MHQGHRRRGCRRSDGRCTRETRVADVAQTFEVLDHNRFDSGDVLAVTFAGRAREMQHDLAVAVFPVAEVDVVGLMPGVTVQPR